MPPPEADEHSGQTAFAREAAPLMRSAVRLGEDIAVIGMSGQFPQAQDLDAFWENLRQGKDCVAEIPASRWPVSAYFDGRRFGPLLPSGR